MVSGGGKLQSADRQMSEAFITSVFLAMSGGFQDAYTYFTRDEVFSNAQTGNVVLMSQNFMTGQWGEGLRYLFPVLAFAIGVVAAERIQSTFKYAKKLHWRQMILLIEILILFAVGFMPGELDMLATVLVSFSCAMQVQAFRKVNSFAFASTMCIGNIRSGMESLCAYRKTHNKETLYKASHYFGVILLFALGAGLGSRFIALFGLRTIWVSCLLLLVSFLLMFIKQELEEHPEIREEEKAIQDDLHDLHKEAREIAHILKDEHSHNTI